MKKILILVLALIMACTAFTSCGCQETPDDPEDEGTSEGGAIEDNPLPLIPVKPVQ